MEPMKMRRVLCAGMFLVTGLLQGVRAEPVKVVVTTGMLADVVRQIGGDRVEVGQLMGPGVDPHLYKPTAEDAATLGRADVVFFNGLLLEGRMAELFAQLGASGRKVYAAADSIPKDRLLEPPEFKGHFDPHIWLDVALWAQTIPTLVHGLSEADPAGKAVFEENGAALTAKLAALDAWCKEIAATLPEERRVLVTSHDAYNYFGRAYGFKVIGLQGVSTVSEASLADMASLVDFIKKQGVKAIFVENSVNPAAISRVAEDAGVQVGGELFSDAMGRPGSLRNSFDTGTYDGMIRANLSTIVNALR